MVPCCAAGIFPWYIFNRSTSLKSNNNAEIIDNSMSNKGAQSVESDDVVAYTKRLNRYCHTSLLDGSELTSFQSHEGTLGNNEQFELVQVHVVARHGDRTPVSNYEIGSKVFFQCGLVDETTYNWEGLNDFPSPVALPPSAKVKNSHLPLNPGTESRDCGDVKAIGKLTKLGYQQHASLGALIAKKYSTFWGTVALDPVSIHRSLFVHSTDYSRTIRSATAFLLGFLPDIAQIRQAVNIHISKGPYLEAPPTDFQAVYHHCHVYDQLWNDDRAESGYFHNEIKKHHLLSSLCAMFRIQTCHLPIVSRVFEHVMIRGCHKPSDMMPCYKHTGDCVGFTQARKLFEFADWVWSNEHPPKSSIIGLMPFLKHSVLDPIERLIMIDSNTVGNLNSKYPDRSAFSTSYRVMLSFTHDDTIVMLMTSLGLKVHEWMPYASRVVFELWKRKTRDDTGTTSRGDYMIRILFNGVPVTEQTGAWKDGTGMYSELVPYPVLKEYLTTGEYRDVNSYNKICHI